MAEVKNAFIKSKMNRDLDDRLIPSGEYREAFNAQISRSEGDDVGALENILGNSVVLNGVFEVGQSYADNLTAIGYTVDERSNCIYVFLTDGAREFTSDSYIKNGNGSNHFIYQYNVATTTATKLVEGPFLNFSKNFPIYGINLIEDLLFFTDNFNQPRKINVATATSSPGYYYNEDQISVSKYNPWQPIDLYQEITADRVAANPLLTAAQGEYDSSMRDVVSKFLPNGGTATVTVAATSSTTIDISNIDIPFYQRTQTTSDNVPQVGMTVGVINFSGGKLRGPIVDTGAKVSSLGYASPVVNLDNSITVDVNDQLVFNFNHYYNDSYAGDSRFLEDKFARFTYRFRYDDNEYSIFAPFTQPCFIPKQDGYFLNTEQNLGDQQNAFDSTIVDFMENKVNELQLNINLPTTGNLLASEYKVKEIDILYKTSDSLAVQVVETIPITEIASSAGNSNIFIYNYINKKPFKTLPENELIRVYDKTPVKALSQEIISNRVVYGNYQNKQTPPDSIDYYVAVGEKQTFNLNSGTADTDGAFITSTTVDITNLSTNFVPSIGQVVTGSNIAANTLVVDYAGTLLTLNKDQTNVTSGTTLNFDTTASDLKTTSIVEYPNSTLKTNRTYQVGIVLSDRFGRQSSVILSNNKDVITVADISYSGDTVYAPYPDPDNLSAGVIPWPGNSLRVSFNSIISAPTTNNQFWPGIYNGDKNSDDYNPLGWYSYKIVVKQNEQEYYNVYTAGAIKGLPYNYETNSILPIKNQNTSFVTLINDNINKIPRDLSEVGPQDKTFRSSVVLFGRVMNTANEYSNTGNEQYYPERQSFTTNAIEDLYDLFDVQEYENQVGNIIPITDNRNPFYSFYKSDSNPFIGEFVTSQNSSLQFGVNNNSTQSPVPPAANNANLNAPGGTTDGDIIFEIDGITAGFAPEAGQLVTSPNAPAGNTIEDGTYVKSFDRATGQLTLSKAQGILLDNTVLAFFDIFYDSVENLAIFETAPTISNLDIYWETSSAGLISDLNFFIENSTTSSAALLSGFDTTPFDERMTAGDSIISTPFEIVNNFGIEYNPQDYDIDVDLVSVVNGNDTNVEALYFNFVENIQPTEQTYDITVKQQFIDDIYYGQDANVRIFTFTFSVKLKELNNPDAVESTTTIVKQANVANLSVDLFQQDFFGGNITPLPATENLGNFERFRPAGVYIPAQVLKRILAQNGSNPGVAPFQDPTNVWKELTCTIQNVLVGTTDVTNQNYFTIQTQTVSNNANYADFYILNDSNIPINTATGYDVTVIVTDGGGAFKTYDFNVTFGQVITSIKQVTMIKKNQTSVTTPVVVIETPQVSNPALSTFYVYDGNWTSLANTANNGVIAIDNTNAAKKDSFNLLTCGPTPRIWSKNASESVALLEVWGVCSPSNFGNNNNQIGGSTTITPTGFSFEKV